MTKTMIKKSLRAYISYDGTKYIYITISQLPILNGIFIFLGGLASICSNGERI